MEKLATVDNNQKIIFGRKELSEAIKERRRIARQVRLEKTLLFELSVDEIKERLVVAKPHCVFHLDTGSHIPPLLP